MIKQFLEAPRWAKRAISVAYDVTAVYFAFYASWALRVGNIEYYYNQMDQISVTLAACVSIIIFVRLGLYRAILRYVTHEAFITIAIGATLSSLTMAAASFMIGGNMPRSLPIIYGCIVFIAVGAPRILFRNLIFWLNPRNKSAVIIYGAGETGHHLASALQMGSEYQPIAFVDDNLTLQNSSIRGIQVFSPSDIPNLILKYKPEAIFIALGETNRKQTAVIVKNSMQYGLKVSSIPNITEIIRGKTDITKLRDLQISDILGRDPVQPIQALLDCNIRDKSVLVTGGGGSIGSELCRQILKINPKKLIIVDNSELNLYKLSQEFYSEISENDIIEIVLADIRNDKSISDTIRKFRPETIFHAAAYKHVPLVESNSWEGIRNNTYGTLVTAEAAIEFGVKSFVFISTDKAVRPTNIMGATKRMAEILIHDLQLSPKNKATKFSTVRFGNVLDSSGSVVPKFREQIKAGGPVTVTHKDVTRYFMTMEEAAQLVIQASAMNNNSGDVFVLDMGEPINIYELAENMISLAASRGQFSPKDAPNIVITGLRPGEKLYEELLINGQCSGTLHPRIWMDDTVPMSTPENLITQFKQAILNKNIPELEKLVLSKYTGYCSAGNTEINKRILQSVEKNGVIVNFPS